MIFTKPAPPCCVRQTPPPFKIPSRPCTMISLRLHNATTLVSIAYLTNYAVDHQLCVYARFYANTLTLLFANEPRHKRLTYLTISLRSIRRTISTESLSKWCHHNQKCNFENSWMLSHTVGSIIGDGIEDVGSFGQCLVLPSRMMSNSIFHVFSAKMYHYGWVRGWCRWILSKTIDS